MITKAIIISKQEYENTNKYFIRIPYFEQANVRSNGSTEVYYEAILSTIPGISNSYDNGDVVLVSFEDHNANKPVIIGKLYLTSDSEPRGFANLDALNVSGSTTLSEDTTIAGVSIQELLGTIEELKFKVEILEQQNSNNN